MLLAAAPISLASLAPELILATVGCVVLLTAQAGSAGVRRATPWIALAGIVGAVIVLRLMPVQQSSEMAGGLRFDSFSSFVRISALIFGVVVLLANWVQPRDEEIGEYFSMLLFSLAGLMLAGAASDLLILFLALELVSIPTYVMVALSRRNPMAVEGATKYFYLGAMAAAITAFGFSYLYGVMGTTSLDTDATAKLVRVLHEPRTPAFWVASLGVFTSLIGLFFKLAAVPMHFYIADVYHGAAAPVAGLLGFVPKLAGLAAIFRLLGAMDWPTAGGAMYWTLWIVAAVSMTVGNVLALRQSNIKRMLGYSGIAHSGYMLVGVLAGTTGGSMMSDGPAAVMYYVFIYGLANLTAFALLGLLRTRGRPCETLRDVAGLLRDAPGPALLMALAMFTLMGLPPTPGFWGKLSLFGSALAAADTMPVAVEGVVNLQHWTIALVIIAVLNSALAAAYYLRVIAAVLLFENDQPAIPQPREAPLFGALLCGFLLLIFAFYPRPIMRMARQASDTFSPPTATAMQIESEMSER